MSKKIYKYFPPDALHLVFEREGFCGIKCSLPKDYNDPYELFLGVDLDVGPEILATYREIVFEVPQFPTTCFSKSPSVPPMWAHYARNHSGFVVEFDTNFLGRIPNLNIRDVTYRSEPDKDIALNLQRAAVTKKPRHAVWLRQAVIHHAYFSKYPTWSYEQECRLVSEFDQIETLNGNMILFMPIDSVTRIIVGKSIEPGELDASRLIAKELRVSWLKANVGKSISTPYFTDEQNVVYVFDGEHIVEATTVCEKCAEPFDNGDNLCPWCSITQGDKVEAAMANPLRVLDRLEQLDDYLEQVRRIHED